MAMMNMDMDMDMDMDMEGQRRTIPSDFWPILQER